MTIYVILLPGDEAPWADATPDERTAVYARHSAFAEALASRGHKITGGAELAHSSTARTVRHTAGGPEVSEGPYAETVEQLSGFYQVESDDLGDLLDCVGILVDGAGGVEVRAVVPAAEAPAS